MDLVIRPRRSFLAAALAIALIAGAAAPARAASSPSLEQAVKASFLFKFAPFVEWPVNAFSGAGKVFTICLSGEDPFGATLDEVVRGQRIAGRPVVVRRLGESGNITGCQILFAGASSTAGTLAAAADQPLLTVSDRKTGVSGTMIQFVMQGGRVRFQIDNGMARSNGLAISSKLLGLATAVEGK